MSLSRSVLLGGLPPASQPADASAASQAAAATQGSTGSEPRGRMQAMHQAGATPWSRIVAELGLNRAEAAQASSELDPHGWGAIVAELGLGRVSQPAAHRQLGTRPSSSGSNAEATPWAKVIAEAGLAPGATPPSALFGADPDWASLAAEAAAEPSNPQP